MSKYYSYTVDERRQKKKLWQSKIPMKMWMLMLIQGKLQTGVNLKKKKRKGN